MDQETEHERDDAEAAADEAVAPKPDEKVAVAPDASFRPLDPAAIKMWRLEGLVSLGVILLVTLIVGPVLTLLRLIPGWIAPMVVVVVGTLTYFSAGWYPPRRYAAWSYRLSEHVLELRYGVLWQTSVMIPLTRLQHVDLKRGPLDRRWGLATLEVHTAGTSQASHEIPNLRHETGLSLREQLVAAADLQTDE